MGSVEWSDLFLSIVLIAIVVTCVYIVIFIRNLNDSVKVVKSLLKENKENLDETLKNIPSISKNLAEITDTAKGELKMMESAISGISETVQMTAATAETVKNDLVGKLKGVLDLIEFIKKLFFKDKDKEGVKKEE